MSTSKNMNFIVLLFLFFGWGFVTCLNDLLTPILKGIFELNQFQANFVSLAFFTAYFVGSLFYIICSALGFKFFLKLGYKGLIILGLILAGLGCLIFIPAAAYKSYPIFLIGLFSIGFGFTFLQISANPLVLISGDPKTGASRLNIAGGFNSLATTIAPLIGVVVFYNWLDVKNNHEHLKYPYIFLSLFFVLIAILISRQLHTRETHTFNAESGKPYALNHANLLFGMLAIFFYVGAEVAVGTNLVAYLKSSDTVNLAEDIAGKFLAFYWGGAMIGRFLGGVALSEIGRLRKLITMCIIAVVLTLLLIYTVNLSDQSLYDKLMNLKYYLGFEISAIMLFMFIGNPRVNLVLFSIVNIINLIIGSNIHDSWFAAWAILSIGLFNSIMWPNIFDLAIDGLGKYKEQASSFLIMMILGGAILPVVQGHIADQTNIVISFLVPLVGYVYILGYSVFYSKKQLNLIK